MALTSEYDNLIAEAASKYQVPFDWIKAVIGCESNFDAAAYRAEAAINDASYGLMQVLYGTAKNLGYQGLPQGLLDPATNIDLGTKLLRQLIDRFGMMFEEIYSAYNSGAPRNYLTNPTVRAHVDNALSWLRKVQGQVASSAPLLFALAGALLLLARR